MKEKEKAKKQYEKAVSTGQTAGLVKWVDQGNEEGTNMMFPLHQALLYSFTTACVLFKMWLSSYCTCVSLCTLGHQEGRWRSFQCLWTSQPIVTSPSFWHTRSCFSVNLASMRSWPGSNPSSWSSTLRSIDVYTLYPKTALLSSSWLLSPVSHQSSPCLWQIVADIYEPQGIAFLDAYGTFISNELLPLVEKTVTDKKV